MNYDDVLNKLSLSKFRSSFKLKNKDFKYIEEKGIDTIYNHTIDFINKRLALKNIQNDGSQTPMKGHPTFIAQHATATCCRKCLYKWHHIPQDSNLNDEEIEYICGLIIAWINIQIANKEQLKEIPKRDIIK